MTSLFAKPITWLVLGLVLVSALTYLYTSIREDATAVQRAEQEKANARFSVQANKGIVGYDTCDLADGVYDFAKGTCKLPAAQ